ncbi:MAG: hypothetical protein R2706_05755 [Acidimicrobiales bacterium]
MANKPPKPALALRRLVTRKRCTSPDHELSTHSVMTASAITTNRIRVGAEQTDRRVCSANSHRPVLTFLDTRMSVDVASPLGSRIPVDPLSLRPLIRTAEDDRYLGDPVLRQLLETSLDLAVVDGAD